MPTSASTLRPPTSTSQHHRRSPTTNTTVVSAGVIDFNAASDSTKSATTSQANLQQQHQPQEPIKIELKQEQSVVRQPTTTVPPATVVVVKSEPITAPTTESSSIRPNNDVYEPVSPAESDSEPMDDTSVSVANDAERAPQHTPTSTRGKPKLTSSTYLICSATPDISTLSGTPPVYNVFSLPPEVLAPRASASPAAFVSSIVSSNTTAVSTTQHQRTENTVDASAVVPQPTYEPLSDDE